MTLRKTRWRGVPAYVLENDRLCVITTPGVGAKITSIRDKRAGHEWLVAPHDRPFRPLICGDVFVEQDMSGWDEMYPTIQACNYPATGSFAGLSLPDHGEVWTLPWQVVEAADNALTLRVEGRALPYRLTRTLALHGDSSIRLHYTVTNIGDQPLAALWSAHPQFTTTLRTRIELPQHITELYNVHDALDWGAPGTRYTWPGTTTQGGVPVRLDRITTAHAHTCRKLYVPPDVPVEWAALVEPSGNHWLLMQWDAAQLPYLGIWVDECTFNSVPTVALEVTNGFHDSLHTAWQHQRCPVIAPSDSHKWQVRLQVGFGPLPVR